MQLALRVLIVFYMIIYMPVALSDRDEDLVSFKNAYENYESYYKQGNLRKSLPEVRLAYELGGQLFGKESLETAKLAYNYGNNLLRLRHYSDAESKLTEALEIFEQNYGQKSFEQVPVLMDLGHTTANTHESNASKKFYTLAFKISEVHYGGESAEFGWFSVRSGIDMIMMSLDPDKMGLRHLQTGYDILRSSLGENHVRTGFAAYHLGGYEVSSKHYKKAKQYLLKALATFENPDEPSSKIELSTHAHLVRVYEELGDRESATKHSLAIGRMTPFESTQSYFPIYKKAPVYPKSALRRGKEGYVILEFDVDENGFIREPRVIATKGGKIFEQPSLDVVKTFRYAPRFIDGQAVVVNGVQNKLTFSIIK
jgi:TonB family protein